MERFNTLDDYFKHSWNLLFQAVEKRNDPMRTPVFGTLEDQESRLRMVVLRYAEPVARRTLFYTDARSNKIADLQRQPRSTVLYWHPQKKIQIRQRGKVVLHQENELTAEHWSKLSVRGRSSYATIDPPGTPVDQSTNGLPEHWSDEMALEDTVYAYPHFMIIDMKVDYMDCLHLQQEGHQRASWQWSEDRWRGSWLVP